MQPKYQNTTISMIITDFSGEHVMLAHQAGADRYYLPSGSMNGWESVEEAVCRLVTEKTAMEAETLRFNREEYYKPTLTRILNYTVQVAEPDLKENGKLRWLSLQDALQILPEESQSKEFLESWVRNSGNVHRPTSPQPVNSNRNSSDF